MGLKLIHEFCAVIALAAAVENIEEYRRILLHVEDDRSLRPTEATESRRCRIEIETSLHSELQQAERSNYQQYIDNGNDERRRQHTERQQLQWQFEQRCHCLQ